MQIDTAAGCTSLEYQPAAVGDHDRQQIGEVAKQIKQDIGQPGPDDAPGIADFSNRTAVRPARITRVIAGKGYQQVDAQRAEYQQCSFAQSPRDMMGQFAFLFLFSSCLSQNHPLS